MVQLRQLGLLLLMLLLLAGCKRRAPVAEAIVLPVVTDASTELLFTWIDEEGEFHVEQRTSDVPAGARELVRVADPLKDPPKLDDVFVANLASPGADGAYPVRTMSRVEFEEIAVERRQRSGSGDVLAPKPADSAPPAAARPDVVIYGASWCGPCHQAAAYLKKRGVSFIEKDIEEDHGAAREMKAKLTKAGVRGGSIPVLDVKGKVLVGFDERAVDRALGSR